MSHIAFMRTKPLGPLSNFQSCSAGCYSININGMTSSLLAMNFTNVHSYDDVINVIQTAYTNGGVGITLVKVVDGDDTMIDFRSNLDGMNSYVSSLYNLSLPLGIDISGSDYLNGQEGEQCITLDVYSVNQDDIDSINQNNASHTNRVLSVMNMYNLGDSTNTGQVIEKTVIEMHEYQDWYNSLDSLTPFSERTAVTVSIDNS